MVSDLPVAEIAAPAAPPQNPLVDVLVRVLVADALIARRTASDRLEVSTPTGQTMEWCCVGDMAFGRSTADQGEASWLHRINVGGVVAPTEAGREIGRIVRGLV